MLARSPIVIGLIGLFSLGALGAAAFAVERALRGRLLRSAQLAYVAASAGALALCTFFFGAPASERPQVLHEGPHTDLTVTLLCVALAWGLLGALLVALERRPWNAERVASLVCFALLALLYLNILRERTEFDDLNDYVRAAEDIASGRALHYRYVYPPLLATLLSPLVALGHRAPLLALVAANYLSLGVLYFLLRQALIRYGFASLTASLCTLIALVANVAVLRTLLYGQINLHVVNLILITLLAYPSHVLISAIALALAVHLKTSPILLALPFVVRRDLRWLTTFGGTLLALVGLTSLVSGPERYLEFAHNVQRIYEANGINFRDNSFDGLMRATLALTGGDLADAFWPVQISRVIVLATSLLLAVRALRNESFYARGTPTERAVYNMVPMLCLLLLTFSPLLWEHHPVFILLTMLLLFTRIDGRGDGLLWLISWFLCFATPTFDLYPLSYRILVGVAVAYWLGFRVTGRAAAQGRWFLLLDRGLARVPALFEPTPSPPEPAPLKRRPPLPPRTEPWLAIEHARARRTLHEP